MVTRKRLSIQERMRVVVLNEVGYTLNSIAKQLKIGRRTVQEIVKKYADTGDVQDRPGRGRKKKTSPREDRKIIQSSIKDRRKSARDISKEIKEEIGLELSSRTIRRRLLNAGLKSCRAKKKPLLSQKARQKRLQWALEHRIFVWDNVVFSDESRFCLVSDRPVIVRRRPGEEYLPECLNTTMKHGGGGIMVWGCIARNGIGRLHKIDGNVNAQHYLKILKYCALPSMQHLYGDQPAIFQQDNAPCHTAKVVKEWIHTNNINTLSWPGNSPDLNPIENVWDHLARQLTKEKFNNGQELLKKLKMEWEKIPLDYVQKLIDSMPNRIEAIIKAKGGATRY